MKFLSFYLWRFLFILILPCLILAYACNVDKEKVGDVTKLKVDREGDRVLKRKILLGDTSAYIKLRDLYIQNDNPADFLVWALIMANKYKFNKANYDVFFCIQEINTYYGEYSKEKKAYINTIDSATDEFSKNYLFKLSDTILINKSLKSYSKD